MKQWKRFFYQPGLPLGADGRRVTGSPKHIEISKHETTCSLEDMIKKSKKLLN